MVSPRLWQALEPLLPGPLESLLLQACLAPGDTGRSAWTSFEQRGGNLTELFRTDRGELKRLAPLLLASLRSNQAPATPELLTVLKTSALREELRAAIYLDVLGEAETALDSAGVRVIRLGGAALGPWVYRQMAERHAHDIDFLVEPGSLSAARAALAGAGFLLQSDAEAPAVPGSPDRFTFLHRTSLPVTLRSNLYQLSCHPTSWSDQWQHTDSAAARSGARIRNPAPEDALACALGRAAHSPSRLTLQWVCDAWRVAEAAPGLEGNLLAETLETSRFILPAALMLRYLRGLGAPLSNQVVEEIGRRAGRTGAFERDIALYGMRRGAGAGFRSVLGRVPGPAARLALLTWVAWPSVEYARWTRSGGSDRPRPFPRLQRLRRLLIG